jgi:hypothetical protein
MENVKAPWASKINLTGLTGAIIGVLAAINVIPEAMQEQVTEAALIVMGVLIPILRTWFTSAKISIGEK